MKSTILALLVCTLLASFATGARATLGFPDSYRNIAAESGKYDASSGDVIFANADHESGAKIQISYNSRVPVKNEEMPRFLEFMSSLSPGGSKFENGKIIRKDGVNWCIVDLTNPAQPKNEKIKILFVSFDGSPMKMTFRSKTGVDLEKVALEFIDYNNQVLVEQGASHNAGKPAS